MMPQLSPDASNNIHDVMCAEHVRLDGVFGDLYRTLEADTLDAARPLFDALRLGLTRQGQAEEEWLMPLIRERGTAREALDAERSSDEYARVREFLDDAEQALSSGTPDAARRTLQAITQLMSVLKGHDRNRDRCLYPAADRVTTPDERADLIRRIQAG